jgi:hypothetical protein
MSIADCQKLTKASKISVSERGRTATFVNEERRHYVKTQFDGCVLRETTAADWVVSKPPVGCVIVELKGKNVEHAVRQVLATAKYWLAGKLLEGRIAGLIVCARYPRVDTTVQRSQQEFTKQFKGPLHIVCRNGEYDIECVLSFRGPHRK